MNENSKPEKYFKSHETWFRFIVRKHQLVFWFCLNFINWSLALFNFSQRIVFFFYFIFDKTNMNSLRTHLILNDEYMTATVKMQWLLFCSNTICVENILLLKSFRAFIIIVLFYIRKKCYCAVYTDVNPETSFQKFT